MLDQLRYKSGGRRVLESGSVIFPSDKPLEMIFDDDGAERIFRFYFASDPRRSGPRTEIKRNGKNVELTFYNFRGASVEHAWSAPLEIGKLKKKGLSLLCAADSLFESEKETLLHYMWLIDND
jgi:hypothetical protein